MNNILLVVSLIFNVVLLLAMGILYGSLRKRKRESMSCIKCTEPQQGHRPLIDDTVFYTLVQMFYSTLLNGATVEDLQKASILARLKYEIKYYHTSELDQCVLVETRYNMDQQFKTIVDGVLRLLDNASSTPSELRCALSMAANEFEQHRVMRIIVDKNGEIKSA